jgi:NADH-quinone oxidoreductase subunit N
VNANLVPLAVAGIVASVIGAFYYIAIIKTMYFDDKSDTEFPKGGGAIVEDAVITASALWLSVIGYLFIPVLAVVSASAAAVLF